MIDLCKLFGVEDGEEFKLKGENKAKCRFRIYDNEFQYYSDNLEQWLHSIISLNSAAEFEIIKLPKKKEFTDDELCILKSIGKTWDWIARDKDGKLYLYHKKPVKRKDTKDKWVGSAWIDFYMYDHLFNSITWEDEEPVSIDDYVER